MSETVSNRSGRSWPDMVGIFAVVFGLLFVGYEIHQSREIAKADRATAAGEVEASVRASIVENADVWHRGCLGEDLTDSERTAFQHLVFAVSFKAFTRWNGSQTSVSSANPEAYIRWVGKSVHAFPGFAQAHNTIDWSRNWEEAVSEEVARLRELDPNPIRDVVTCGLF